MRNPQPVFAAASSAILPSGMSVAEVWENIAAGESAVQEHTGPSGEYWGAKFSPGQWEAIASGTGAPGLLPFEQLALRAVQDLLGHLPGSPDPAETLFLLSTTKGAISGLDQLPDDRISLSTSARLIADGCGYERSDIRVVSHACISGVSAMMFAQRALRSGAYRHAIVVGADLLSPFVLSGFQSFQAIAPERCRPFDKDRRGINLGEGAAAIFLTTAHSGPLLARLAGVATSNDANHISGPSRTGAELALAIRRALLDAGVEGSAVDAISAHGTATPYNDEMEGKAFGLSGVSAAPVHSVKGCTGHTLGAAGVVESALLIETMQRGELLPSVGYAVHGVSQPLNIPMVRTGKTVRIGLKTASGFGGCNAAAVWTEV